MSRFSIALDVGPGGHHPDPAMNYKGIDVLILHWSNEDQYAPNAEHLKEVFEEYGATVHLVTQSEIGMQGGRSRAEQDAAVKLWFPKYFERCLDPARLFFFCYLGDAALMVSRPEHSWSPSHLLARCQEYSMVIDLTWIQQYMRDKVSVDKICIFECPFGDYDGMDDRPVDSSDDDDDDVKGTDIYSMFTLSSGPQEIYENVERGLDTMEEIYGIHVDNSRADMTRRFAANLRLDQSNSTIGWRFATMQHDILLEKPENRAPMACRMDVPDVVDPTDIGRYFKDIAVHPVPRRNQAESLPSLPGPWDQRRPHWGPRWVRDMENHLSQPYLYPRPHEGPAPRSRDTDSAQGMTDEASSSEGVQSEDTAEGELSRSAQTEAVPEDNAFSELATTAPTVTPEIGGDVQPLPSCVLTAPIQTTHPATNTVSTPNDSSHTSSASAGNSEAVLMTTQPHPQSFDAPVGATQGLRNWRGDKIRAGSPVVLVSEDEVPNREDFVPVMEKPFRTFADMLHAERPAERLASWRSFTGEDSQRQDNGSAAKERLSPSRTTSVAVGSATEAGTKPETEVGPEVEETAGEAEARAEAVVESDVRPELESDVSLISI